MRTRAVRTAALLGAVGVLTLSGCSLRPGVGLAVGDDTVPNQRIDELTASVCEIQEPQLAAQQQVIPLSLLKANVASTLLNRELTEQAAEAYGVEPDETYQQTVEQTRQQVPVADEGELDDYVDLLTTQAYTESIITAIGLEEAGPGATEEEAQQAGAEAFTAFVADTEIEVDPRYGFSYDGAEVSGTEGASSVAASERALLAADVADATGVAEYAASLPPDQTCGG